MLYEAIFFGRCSVSSWVSASRVCSVTMLKQSSAGGDHSQLRHANSRPDFIQVSGVSGHHRVKIYGGGADVQLYLLLPFYPPNLVI